MPLPSLDEIKRTSWYSYSDEPIALRGALRLCDPFVLLPDESPDGLWHLFAHTWVGIERFSSTSGLEWERQRLLFWRGHSPFVFKNGQTYHLVYESHDSSLLNGEKGPRIEASRIMMSSSPDLVLWSSPKVILDSSKIRRAQWKNGPVRVSRPEIIEAGGRYRLYFGAGETRIYDSGRKATTRLMWAEADEIDGEYRVNPEPLLETDPDSKWSNLALGAIRILPLSDGYAAIECGYSYNREKNRSESNVILLSSPDGLSFKTESLIQESPDEGWCSGAITSVDARCKSDEKTWYCYYSASDRKKRRLFHSKGDSLGLLLGGMPL